MSYNNGNATSIQGIPVDDTPPSNGDGLFYNSTTGEWEFSPGGGGGVSLPVDDTTSIVRDPVDNTKQIRLDAGGLSTSTVGVISLSVASVDLDQNISTTSAVTFASISTGGTDATSGFIRLPNNSTTNAIAWRNAANSANGIIYLDSSDELITNAINAIKSNNIDTFTGGEYRINGTKVLDATSLGSAVVSSSLTSVGTIATGTWEGTDVGVAHGGTGRSSATAYAVICGGTTSTGAHQSVSGVGTSGQVLTSNGAGALPTWQAAGGGGLTWGDSISNNTGTGITITQTSGTGAITGMQITTVDENTTYKRGLYVRTVTDSTNFVPDTGTSSAGIICDIDQSAGGVGIQTVVRNNSADPNGATHTRMRDTQSRAGVGHYIDLGTSAQGHTGLQVNAKGASTSQRGITIDLDTTGTGAHIQFDGGTAAATTTAGALWRDGDSLNFRTSTGTVDLAAGGGGGVSWGDTRTSGTGIGLTHTIGASAASGVQSFVTTLNNTQSNALTLCEIDIGTSALGHVGLLIKPQGNNSSQRGLKVDLSTTGGGRAIEVVGGGTTVYMGANMDDHTFVFLNCGGLLRTATTARGNNVVDVQYGTTVASAATITDDYDVGFFERRNRTNNSSANLTANGSVMHLQNQTINTSGTLNDNVNVLELEQDTDSTGAHILFNTQSNGSVGSTNGQFWYDGTDLLLRTGAANYTIDRTAVSSRRFKDNIRPIEQNTHRIYDLEPVTFEYKSNGETDHGLIAEDTHEILPEIVNWKNDEIFSVNYKGLIIPLLKEIQKLKQEIQSIKS